eukprot:7485784-Heterocapsa_arctica.AAC.1
MDLSVDPRRNAVKREGERVLPLAKAKKTAEGPLPTEVLRTPPTHTVRAPPAPDDGYHPAPVLRQVQAQSVIPTLVQGH